MKSERLWVGLHQLFEEECAVYRRLAELLEEEWTVLKQLDHIRLHDISNRKEEMLQHIGRLEIARLRCVRQFHPIESDQQSLEWILHAQIPDSIPVKQIVRQLISIGTRVKQLSDQNSRLISRGLHIVREAMQVVFEGLGHQPVYGETGGLRFPVSPTSLNIKG